MNREIKFRAYSKSRSRYLGKGDTLIYRHEVGFDGSRWWASLVERQDHSDEDIIVEQYTGLKDKNGNEVYEGDIVKVVRSYGYGFLPKGAKAVVEFDDKELCYKLRGCGEFRLTARRMVEVIGNIHESNMEEV